MRFLCVLLLIVSCGKEVKENPTNCQVEESEEGVKFTCTDKNGVVSSGTVKHGPQGPVGPKGEGLKLSKSLECKGAVEGWMQESSYEIDFGYAEFETGDVFLSSNVLLVREEKVINQKNASAFYRSGAEKVLNDGLFTMKLEGMDLSVKSQGGISVKIPCKELN